MTALHSIILHVESEKLSARVTPIKENLLALRIEESDCYSGVVLFIDNTPENLSVLEQICTLVANIKPRSEPESSHDE